MRKAVFILVIAILAGVGYTYTPQGGGVCSCDSCGDCTDALNDNTNCYVEVQLAFSIYDYSVSDTCIDNPENFTNKIFNCYGNQIDGDGTNFRAVYLDNKENNTIANCSISDFGYGIWLSYSNNNSILNNKLFNNIFDGIYVYSSSKNNFTNNSVSDNGFNGFNLSLSLNNTFSNNNVYGNGQHGFYVDSTSTGNSLDSNTLCANNQLRSNFFDIYDDDSNTFTNNTCDISYPSGKCGNPCSYCYTRNSGGVCTVNAGSDCSCLYSALNDNFNCYNEVRLNGDISNGGTCIYNPPRFQHKTLNCLNNVISGGGFEYTYGIYLADKNNITIKNCVIKNFVEGIRGERIANSSFEYVSAIDNGGYSIFGCYSSAGINLIESYNIKLLHINASSNTGGGTFDMFGCSGTGLYLNVSNSTLNDIIANNNNGGSGQRIGGPGSGLVLEGSHNTLVSIQTNDNTGGGSRFRGGVGTGLLVSGENNNISRVTANNNEGGGAVKVSYGIRYNSVTNTTLSSSTINSNRYGIYVESSANNTFINNKVLSNYFHGIYLDGTSTDNIIRSNRFCKNNQSGNDYYDVYDEDANTFLFNICSTSNPDGLCVASCAPHAGNGEENEHELYIRAIAHQYAKEGERKNVAIIVENIGDYTEYNVAISLNCPPQLSCGNASLGNLHRMGEGNATVMIVGNVVGSYLIKVEARSEATSAEREFYFTVEPECTRNDECVANEKCENKKCVHVECICGYVEKHACVPYECCENKDCDDASVCVEHKCVPIVYKIKIEAANINIGEEFVIKVTADGNPAGGVAIVVVYPDGSTSTVLSNDGGMVVVPARREGKYKFYIQRDPTITEEGYAQPAIAEVQRPSEEERAPPSTCCVFGICGDLLGVCWHWVALSLAIVAVLAAALVFSMRGAGIFRRR